MSQHIGASCLRLLLLMRADASASMRVCWAGADGARQQEASIKALGGAVESQWVLLGRYDLATIATFPDEAIAAAYCLTANAAGYATEVHQAMSPDCLATAQALVEQAFAAATSSEPEGSGDAVPPEGKGAK